MSSLLKRKHVLAAHFGGAARSYQATIVADGAVAYWPLDETSGTTAFDKVGTRHGTISGGVTLNQAGVNGSKCMAFNGVSGKIVSLALLTPNTITLEAWVRTSVAGTMAAVSNRGAAGDVIFHGTNAGKQFINDASIGGGGIATLTNDQWHHIVVIPGGQSPIYLDGQSDGTVTLNGRSSPATSPIGIGVDHPTGTNDNFWNGSLQDIAIYNRALTPAEIQSHYTKRLEGAPFGGLVSTDQLVSVWDFDADFNDKVGTNHLTNVNGVTRVPGKLGNAASFNGVDQRLHHSDPTPLGDESFTYTCWFKRASVPGTANNLIAKDGSGPRSYVWYFFPGTFQFAMIGPGGTTQAGHNTGFEDANWHFAIAWHDAAANTLNAQLDNGTVQSTPTAGNYPGVSSEPFTIGAASNGTQHFNGLIDQVLLFKRILSAAERTALFNSGNGLKY